MTAQPSLRSHRRHLDVLCQEHEAPVIKLSDNSYYCVEAGVWFKATSPQGPWRIVDTVPEEIYTIPPSSPIYYVTYVKVYNSTPEVVYVGYTPGYYGTVVSASTTHGGLRHGMVLPAVYQSHSVVWLALHLRCGSQLHLDG